MITYETNFWVSMRLNSYLQSGWLFGRRTVSNIRSSHISWRFLENFVSPLEETRESERGVSLHKENVNEETKNIEPLFCFWSSFCFVERMHIQILTLYMARLKILSLGCNKNSQKGKRLLLWKFWLMYY